MNPSSIKPRLCRHLRTKKMFIPALEEEMIAELNRPHADGYYWCNRTCTEIGLDDELVGPNACKPGRCCFEAQ